MAQVLDVLNQLNRNFGHISEMCNSYEIRSHNKLLHRIAFSCHLFFAALLAKKSPTKSDP